MDRLKVARGVVREVLTAIHLLFRIMVVIPAGTVGLVIAVLLLLGEHPAGTYLHEVSAWVDTAVRPAPPGSILISQCEDAVNASEITNIRVLCGNAITRVVSVNEVIETVNDRIARAYWLLVFLSLWIVLVTELLRKDTFRAVPSAASGSAAVSGLSCRKERNDDSR